MAVAFAMFDKDGDGVITCSEVLQVMVSLGIDVDSSEVKGIVRKIDLDGKFFNYFFNYCIFLLLFLLLLFYFFDIFFIIFFLNFLFLNVFYFL